MNNTEKNPGSILTVTFYVEGAKYKCEIQYNSHIDDIKQITTQPIDIAELLIKPTMPKLRHDVDSKPYNIVMYLDGVVVWQTESFVTTD